MRCVPSNRYVEMLLIGLLAVVMVGCGGAKSQGPEETTDTATSGENGQQGQGRVFRQRPGSSAQASVQGIRYAIDITLSYAAYRVMEKFANRELPGAAVGVNQWRAETLDL